MQFTSSVKDSGALRAGTVASSEGFGPHAVRVGARLSEPGPLPPTATAVDASGLGQVGAYEKRTSRMKTIQTVTDSQNNTH